MDDSDPGSDDPLAPEPKPPAPDRRAKVQLSSNIKGMRFMQRQADASSAARERRERERALREEQWVLDHRHTTAAAAAGRGGGGGGGGLIVMRDSQSTSMGPVQSFSRRSFRGFNSNVERHRIAVCRQEHDDAMGQEAEDTAIGEDEMAAALGGRVNRGAKRPAGATASGGAGRSQGRRRFG